MERIDKRDARQKPHRDGEYIYIPIVITAYDLETYADAAKNSGSRLYETDAETVQLWIHGIVHRESEKWRDYRPDEAIGGHI